MAGGTFWPLVRPGSKCEEFIHSVTKLLICPLESRKVCSFSGVCLQLAGKPLPGLHIVWGPMGTDPHGHPIACAGQWWDPIPEQAPNPNCSGRTRDLLHALARHNRQSELIPCCWSSIPHDAFVIRPQCSCRTQLWFTRGCRWDVGSCGETHSMPREYKSVCARQAGKEATTNSKTSASTSKESHITALLLSACDKCWCCR